MMYLYLKQILTPHSQDPKCTIRTFQVKKAINTTTYSIGQELDLDEVTSLAHHHAQYKVEIS